jgi:hypothetical protein
MGSLSRQYQKVVRFTPTLDTSAFTANDLMSTSYTIIDCLPEKGSATMLMSLVVIDADAQGQAIDFLFFNQLPTVASAVNAAIDISDAEMQAKYLGKVSILAADYSSLAASKEATAKNIWLLLNGRGASAGKGLVATTSLYMVMVTRSGTPTYTASGITVVLGLEA